MTARTNTPAEQRVADLAAERALEHRRLVAAAGGSLAHQDAVAANVLNHALNTSAALSCAVDGFDYRRWMAEAERNANTVAIVCARYSITPQLLDVAETIGSRGCGVSAQTRSTMPTSRMDVVQIAALTYRVTPTDRDGVRTFDDVTVSLPADVRPGASWDANREHACAVAWRAVRDAGLLIDVTGTGED